MHVKSKKQNTSCFPCKGIGTDVSSICLRLCFQCKDKIRVDCKNLRMNVKPEAYLLVKLNNNIGDYILFGHLLSIVLFHFG